MSDCSKAAPLVLLWAVTLTACGGGGGNSAAAPPPAPSPSPSPSPSPEPTAPSPEPPTTAPPPSPPPGANGEESRRNEFAASAEYLPQYRHINAAHAYARGATGAGQTILVVENRVPFAAHREFAGAGKLRVVNRDGGTARTVVDDHPTGSAGMAAARRDGETVACTLRSRSRTERRDNCNMHGIAFDASIVYVDLRGGGGGVNPVTTSPAPTVDGAAFRDVVARAAQYGAAVATFSYADDTLTAAAGVTESAIRAAYRDAITAMAQAGTAAGDKLIFVRSAGNDGASQPALIAGLPHYIAELRGHYVAAVMTDGQTIASGSNRCGLAADHCIAVPAAGVHAPTGTGNADYQPFTGTSAAAPMVAGALAVMRQHYRGMLGGRDLVDKMFATAKKDGIHAVSTTYGQGLLDLDAATRPTGAVMTGLPGDPGARPLEALVVEAGAAFGGALQSGLGGAEVAGFDELGAPFFYRAERLLQQRRTPARLPMEAGAPAGGGAWWGRNVNGGRALGLYMRGPGAPAFSSPDAFAAPWLSLVSAGAAAGNLRALPGGGQLGWTVQHGGAGSGVAVDYRPAAAALSLQAGAVREADGALGLRAVHSPGAVHGRTWFAGVNGAWQLGARWRALASGFIGRTSAGGGGGILRGMQTVHSSALSAALARRLRHGVFALRMGQPLRAESGRARLRFAGGRTPAGEVLFRDLHLPLAPAARSVEMEALLQSDRGLALGLKAVRHPQHRAQPARALAWLRLQGEF